jgi:hypothetical protein
VVNEIGQRLCDKFDDVKDGDGRIPRVLMAGDACHRHSAKRPGHEHVDAGQVQFGRKLASVLRGPAPRQLAAYSQERQPIAKVSIDF